VVWRQALLDGNASIRELARFHLGRLGEVDWPGAYRRALIEQPYLLAALNGLGETGDGSDLTAIRGHLESPHPSRRRAAVRAFAKLGGESVVADLLGCLQDDSPAVVREVRKLLEAYPSALDCERLCRMAMEDHRQKVRETALRLINSTGKWRSLPWLVRASGHQDLRRRCLPKYWSRHGSRRPDATVCSPNRQTTKSKRSSKLWKNPGRGSRKRFSGSSNRGSRSSDLRSIGTWKSPQA
jgi:hypothetical protein